MRVLRLTLVGGGPEFAIQPISFRSTAQDPRLASNTPSPTSLVTRDPARVDLPSFSPTRPDLSTRTQRSNRESRNQVMCKMSVMLCKKKETSVKGDREEDAPQTAGGP